MYKNLYCIRIAASLSRADGSEKYTAVLPLDCGGAVLVSVVHEHESADGRFSVRQHLYFKLKLFCAIEKKKIKTQYGGSLSP